MVHGTSIYVMGWIDLHHGADVVRKYARGDLHHLWVFKCDKMSRLHTFLVKPLKISLEMRI
jgi:hypothetical protein